MAGKTNEQVVKELTAVINNSAPCSDDIQAIMAVQVKQTEQINTMIVLVDKVVLTLYGNGKPGLTTIISELKSAFTILKWVGTVVGGLVIAFVWAVITHAITITR